MWETTDPDGQRVVLTRRHWRHILARHGELDVEPHVLLRTVFRPDRRIKGHAEREVWYYGREVGPSRWIRVVVHYDQGRGLIVTAFPRRAFP